MIKPRKLSQWIRFASECWLWTGTPHTDGYGRIVRFGRHYRAHVYLFLCRFGNIPTGLVIDHKCDNPLCVNPNHLQAITAAANVRKGRLAKLTVEKAQLIRDRVASGEKKYVVARDLGVSASLVGQIVNGHRWATNDKPHLQRTAT